MKASEDAAPAAARSVGTPRYDGLAEWYDDEIRSGPASDVTRVAVDVALTLLGDGTGSCLDVGCGTGIALPGLSKRGWHAIGVDVSGDQLALARRHHPSASLVRAHGQRLPFADASVEAAVSVLTHTDFDDVGAVFTEIARVLGRKGRFVYAGVHPCFIHPWIDRTAEPHRLHAGYRREGWATDGPGFGVGIRPHVGVNHRTLAGLLNAALDAGLNIDEVVEPGGSEYPVLLVLRTRRR